MLCRSLMGPFISLRGYFHYLLVECLRLFIFALSILSVFFFWTELIVFRLLLQPTTNAITTIQMSGLVRMKTLKSSCIANKLVSGKWISPTQNGRSALVFYFILNVSLGLTFTLLPDKQRLRDRYAP